MNEDTFNLSIRTFLKRVGVNSQREIERPVAAALQQRRIDGTGSLPVKVTLELPGVGLSVAFDDAIRRE